MRLLAIRHAIAEDREEFARKHDDDGARPLTRKGKDKMRRAAAGLKELVPAIDVIAASPLKRAVETAEILARVYDGLNVEQVGALAPGTPLEQAVAWAAGRPEQGTVAFVGHEPDLSSLVCALLANTDEPFLEFQKGAACLLEFTGPVERGGATLVWLLGPKHLRWLGDDGG